MNSGRQRYSKKDVQQIYPLLPMQQGMLFHDLAESGRQPYFRQTVVRIRGPFEPADAERAWNGLLCRHELLRSVFDYENTAHLLQIVLKMRSVEFGFEDLTPLDETSQNARLDRYLRSDHDRGFDLRRDSLIRVRIFRLGGESFAMVWSHPHVLIDGWSGGVLQAEFLELYAAFRRHRTPALPEPPAYSAYLDWQASRDSEAAHAYWQKLLAGYETPVVMPRSRKTKSGGDARASEHVFALTPEQTAGLSALAASNGVTLNTVLLSLWGVLLGRYNDSEDVVFGRVVSGRPAEVPGIEAIVGLFINTTPVRVRTVSDQTFADLLRGVQAQCIESAAHDHFALREIQAASPLKQGLFDHVVVFENYPGSGFDADEAEPVDAGFAVESVRAFEQSNYDFGVLIHPGMPLRMTFNFDARVHTASQMRRLEGHWRTLMDGAIQSGAAPLGGLEILDATERVELEAMSEGARIPNRDGATLVDLWEAQVSRMPANMAVDFGPTRFTYEELNRRANRLAHFLREQCGVGVDERIGVLAGRNEWRIIALLGILKAGGAYLPISPELPDERIAFLAEDGGCRLVLADPPGAFRLDAIRPGLARQIDLCVVDCDRNPTQRGHSTDLAYVIYTSGSTGQPKGVMVEHGGFVNMIQEQIRGFGIGPDDRVLQFASGSFDASLSEIFIALLSGGCLVLAGEDVLRDGYRLVAFMAEQRVTVVTLPPSYLGALDRADFPSLRVLITAGEPPHEQDCMHYAARLRYFNGYGPTETSVCAAYHEVKAEAAYPLGIPAGMPLTNTRVRILDRSLRPVPIGVPGEICVAGPGLARGYLGREQLTSRVFIESPFPGDGRLYRTGDIGCWQQDGTFVVLGRADRQIKFHGYRIELGEIESVMRKFPGIKDAVASVRGDSGTARMAAFFTASGTVDTGSLRGYLSSRLPAYMVPSALVLIDSIPLSGSGKIERNSLPSLPAGGEPRVHDTAERRNPTEAMIAQAWAEVLGHSRFGIHDSFFEAGGDSIRTIILSGRLRREGLSLSLREILDGPTIAQMAKVVGVGERHSHSASISGPVPLTPIQRWFFESHATERNHLNHCVVLEGRSRLEDVRLRRALQAVWDHHDALRLRFRFDEGAVIQEIAVGVDFAGLERVDLLSDENPWNAVEAHAQSLQSQFDLVNGPLFKAVCYRLPGEDVLLLVAHHLVVDAISWRFLLEDFTDAYRQAADSGSIRLPSKTSSFQHWARELEEYSRSESLLAQKPYWRAVESAATPPIERGLTKRSHSYRDTDLLTRTISLSFGANKRSEAEVQSVLLASLAEAMRDWDGRESSRVLLAGHGRGVALPETDVSRTAGWFTAKFPFLLHAPRAVDQARRIAAIRADIARVPDQGIGYGVLRYLTPAELKSEMAFAPEPEISFNYVGRTGALSCNGFFISDRLPNSSIGNLERPYMLEMDAIRFDEDLCVSVRYSPKLQSRQRVEQLAGLWGARVKELAGEFLR